MNASDNQPKSTLTARIYELVKCLSEDEKRRLLRVLEKRFAKGKREHKRKPFFMVVDYSAEDRLYKDYIQNISAGGVFIETQIPFDEGQEISLSFPLPDHQKYIKILGEIVRTSSQGIGVRFKKTDKEQEEMIENLMQLI
jgi:uncharacterized protein (TIGR02266 family)